MDVRNKEGLYPRDAEFIFTIWSFLFALNQAHHFCGYSNMPCPAQLLERMLAHSRDVCDKASRNAVPQRARVLQNSLYNKYQDESRYSSGKGERLAN